MIVSIDNIINELRLHGVSDKKLDEVVKSYLLAEEIHKNQFRQSGEPYIIHPLNVACNLLMMEVFDPDCISAALLHDTIEDADDDFSKEDISELINPTVSELVDGVTKMRRMSFSSKENQDLANTRKIINGLNKDVRIILIKLADRLHNMQTLDFKRPEKQRENAIETMEIFVPLTLAIGAYQIKNQLEDLALKYIEPDMYKRILDGKNEIGVKEEERLKEISGMIDELLKKRDINNEIILRSQTISTTYKKIKKGLELENIYDLFYLKILVDYEEDCFRTLYAVHKNNPPINGRFKDYINNPRTNLYQSLHTTVSDPAGKLLKVKIRTFDMNKVAAYGIPAFWTIKNNKTMEETQAYLRDKCQFAKRLQELDDAFQDNVTFMDLISRELLTDHVYAYSHSGEVIELPAGSTALDFACQVFPDLLDQMTGVLVNGREVALDRILKNNDRVQVVTNGIVNRDNWENYARTSKAKEKIKLLRQNS